jgi:hypothetical protein
MSYICENTRCRHHVLMPNNIPDDSLEVSVVDKIDPIALMRESRATKPSTITHVRRYVYVKKYFGEMVPKFFLCESCHYAVKMLEQINRGNP